MTTDLTRRVPDRRHDALRRAASADNAVAGQALANAADTARLEPFGVALQRVGVRYGAVRAVDDVTAELPAGAIIGLLGRNGAGKTSLMAAIAGFTRPSTGSVRVAGRAPFDDPVTTAGTCLMREAGDFPQESVRRVLSLAALRESWDAELANRLLDRFELPLRNNVGKLSRGQRSALAAVVGIASRAPLTMFDEVYLGMDAAVRYTFYDELLADYTQHPRTVILSSHLIGEVENLFEHVLMLHHGKLLLADAAEALRERGHRVVGPAAEVEAFVGGRTVLARQSLGRTTAATVYGELDDDARAQADALGLAFEPVGIQDLFVHLSQDPEATGVAQRAASSPGGA